MTETATKLFAKLQKAVTRRDRTAYLRIASDLDKLGYVVLASERLFSQKTALVTPPQTFI